MFNSILTYTSSGGITIISAAICTGVSLLLGIGIALLHTYRTSYNKNFIITLALLPTMIQVIIMMVNGNLGTGVAVLGAFSLVRFRSVPGSAREIGSIVLSMAVGLATGMGCVGFAVAFTLVIGLAMLLLTRSRLGERSDCERELKITLPENLNYTNLFDDLFDAYTRSVRLDRVKTTNMGTLYELNYQIVLKDPKLEREFLDEIRCRNGNLNIICGRVPIAREEL